MIAVSARTLLRNVGGNTRYAREVYGRLSEYGIAHLALAPRIRTPHSWAAWEAMALQRSARDRGAQLVHYPADTGPAHRARHIPTVVTIHGVAQLHDRAIRRPVPARMWMERTRLAGRVADVIITVSQSSADDVARLVGPAAAGKVHIIPQGIDHTQFFIPEPAHVNSARRAYASDSPYILFIGNLEPRKNVVQLVRAVESLNQNGTECELLVGGKPAWDAADTIAAIDGSPNARRLGFVDEADLPGLMAGASAFAFPSRYEGFGLPVVEALACGANVVCSRNGSLPEVAGQHVHYCDGTTAQQIEAALATALAVGHASSPTAGAEWTQQFDWARSTARHCEIFRDLM